MRKGHMAVIIVDDTIVAIVGVICSCLLIP